MFPPNVSETAHHIDDLFHLALMLTSVTFVLVISILAVFMLKYRAREGHTALFTHGNSRGALLLTLTLAITVFVGIDCVLAFRDHHAYQQVFGRLPDEKNSVVVQVFAKQFEWNFRYAGNDGQFGTDDDVCSVGKLRAPAGKDVLLRMRSRDVIHSVFLPNLRHKQDVVPGLTVAMGFHAAKTTAGLRRELGDDNYDMEIVCTELCGSNHSNMRGVLEVLTQAEFDDWLRKTSEAGYASPEIWSEWENQPALERRVEE